MLAVKDKDKFLLSQFGIFSGALNIFSMKIHEKSVTALTNIFVRMHLYVNEN